MTNFKGTNSCLFGEQLVAYIYDELEYMDRNAFEDHLQDCSGCTAEFADISISRLGVYEWHRDEFAPLATPHFAIPYDAPEPKVSWLNALLGLIASPIRLGFAGASLAITIFGFVIISNYGTNETSVAGAIVAVPIAPVSPAVPVTESKPSVIESVSKREDKARTVREFRNAQPVGQAHVVHAKATGPKTRPDTVKTTTASSGPRLGSFVDTEDRSLRLADLVADIGTRD